MASECLWSPEVYSPHHPAEPMVPSDQQVDHNRVQMASSPYPWEAAACHQEVAVVGELDHVEVLWEGTLAVACSGREE